MFLKGFWFCFVCLFLSDVSSWWVSSYAHFDGNMNMPAMMYYSQYIIISGGTRSGLSQYQLVLMTWFKWYLLCKILFFPLQGIDILGELLWDHVNILFLKISLIAFISHWQYFLELDITKRIAKLWLQLSNSIIF